MYDGDIVIHLHQSLDDTAIHGLLRETSHDPGVRGACVSDRARHLMVVDFDAKQTTPSAILHSIRQRGHRAQMVGF
jgi:hypothetical protein